MRIDRLLYVATEIAFKMRTGHIEYIAGDGNRGWKNVQMQTGRLKHWNDDRGFGLIDAPQSKDDVFLHISALKKARMTRRPRVGDQIHYDLDRDNKGRPRAVNARIEGVAAATPRSRSARPKRVGRRGRLPSLLSIPVAAVLMVMVGITAYDQIARLFAPSAVDFTGSPSNEQRFSCQGKVYCSEMNSCEEARFYLRECPGTKMDGDRDGIPCEKQWCTGW
jgi:cold shock CspA family protein